MIQDRDLRKANLDSLERLARSLRVDIGRRSQETAPQYRSRLVTSVLRAMKYQRRLPR